jgi:hypothetical protein
VAQIYDFDEIVELLDIRRQLLSEGLVGIGRASMPLRDALATVVEGWADNKFRQLSAIIVRTSGPSLRTFEEINGAYQESKRLPRDTVEIERTTPGRWTALSSM